MTPQQVKKGQALFFGQKRVKECQETLQSVARAPQARECGVSEALRAHERTWASREGEEAQASGERAKKRAARAAPKVNIPLTLLL